MEYNRVGVVSSLRQLTKAVFEEVLAGEREKEILREHKIKC